MTDRAAYIDELSLSDVGPTSPRTRSRGLEDESQTPMPVPVAPAFVNGGSLISFVSGLSDDDARDVLCSVQLAQRGASGAFNRFTQTPQWYAKYIEVLGVVGWTSEQLAFTEYNQGAGQLQMDKAALEVIAAVATGQQLQILTKSLEALRQLSSGDAPITLFEFNALAQASGNFQLGTVQKGPQNTTLTMGLGAFYFTADKKEHQFLFFKWGARETHFWTAVQKLTLDPAFYAPHRDQIAQKLGTQARDYISALTLA